MLKCNAPDGFLHLVGQFSTAFGPFSPKGSVNLRE